MVVGALERKDDGLELGSWLGLELDALDGAVLSIRVGGALGSDVARTGLWRR